jgi:hypothetical protein
LGLIEECVGVDGKILSEVIIPMMNVDRRCLDGSAQPTEVLNKSQIYVTTAGYRNTFSYDKLITLLVRMSLEPEKAFIMGGTWRIPVLMGLQNKSFIQDLKNDGTYNEESFGREYESSWAGASEDAFFNADFFDRNRKLQKPEHEYSGHTTKTSYYILSVDVGRKGCDTVVSVLKVIPQTQGPAVITLVNIITMSDMHFEDQSRELKKLYYRYKARRLVVDGNGLGIGLIDYMVKTQIDVETGEIFPDFGIENDLENYYKKFHTNNTEDDAIYIIKANAQLNTEAHVALQVALQSGKIKFLLEEKVAKEKLLLTKVGQAMTPEERKMYLRPFLLTNVLKEELLNLRQVTESNIHITLRQINNKIGKDKVSSLEYGLYYIKLEEEKKKKRKKFKASDWNFFT